MASGQAARYSISDAPGLLAVGRNIKAGAHKGLGLHDVDSVEGRHILEEAEGGRQGPLDFAS
jgi:hypothetical protein